MTATVLQEAQAAAKADNLAKAEHLYRDILSKSAGNNEKAIAEQETALYELGALYRDHRKIKELGELIHTSRTVMSGLAKSKVAKIIRALIDLFSTVPGTIDTQITVTKDCIAWAVSERRNFLRQSLETRLVSLYIERGAYFDALNIINTLLKELKRLDDKMVLVEVQLFESRVYHALRNIPKSRAALTSARTSANAIYCPTLMQASLDMQSGILHAEDKDYKTAFSYFVEALEGYSSQEDARAVSVLKYMLLCKIMLNLTDDVHSLLTGKMAQKYAGRDIEAMKAVAAAHSNRSLKEFEEALETYKTELSSDPIIRSHFSALYDTLLEQNLVRVIEPFSCVEISHVAEIVGLDTRQVEGKLSQMILDKVFYGVLDQGNGWLIVFDEQRQDATYDAALDTVRHMTAVVDLLYEKASKLN
ncbi:hypothetical protein POJ06DRAFT_89909 [Lipomyces tetrasporus]|uniref:PCI domain-containing protein n=1 Tax=Lipomyces tetrasporus TaxID=54092 RepID=A0AAD7QTD5_9ASCO|nr:uncharacterized protein POJ06DRAFT_89909 [Lipomyces tetrasporus]KAJ8101157.1 hypothetical protein POJ06DRAFT_89909 [Lipomyces tetrasporus]